MANYSRIPPDATKVFEGVIYDIYQWPQKLYDGSIATFEMAKHVDAVGIIPIIDDSVMILREEQPRAVPRICFPGGQIDKGETPYEAAVRELSEETGYRFKNIRLVKIHDLGGPKMDWWIYHFVATDPIEEVPVKLDPGEKIERELVTYKRAQDLAQGNLYMQLWELDQLSSLGEVRALPEVKL